MIDNTEHRIVEKATSLYTQYGIRTISMDDIARDLAISKKTIYKYFKDKKELVHSVTNGLISRAQNMCQSKIDASTSAVDELFKIIEFINIFFQNLNPSLVYDLEKYYPESFKVFQKHQNEFVLDRIQENLRRGIDERTYLPNLNIAIVARLRLGQIRLAFSPSLFPPDKFELKKVQLTSMELYMMGITTEKGRKAIEKYNKEHEVSA
ncbi:MAG: TetR family transcriptional regulator [Bacteroidetes bacterium]|nr:MAG: TetR family transcriptional regulator [Bacteroidota bacterium]